MVIDLESKTPMALIPIGSGRPTNVDVNSETNMAIVANSGDFRVAVIDLTKQTVTFSVRLPFFNSSLDAVAFNPVTNTIVAAGVLVSIFKTPYLPFKFIREPPPKCRRPFIFLN
ncbi:MAG: hypothetical protein HYR55_09120 [Acidobacteria bacterium]|nr:hypothetical protein [Acidobacteriota bacterium]MBI3658173.1 hypothetical protein [Acidobacteriota bacterium]